MTPDSSANLVRAVAVVIAFLIERISAIKLSIDKYVRVEPPTRPMDMIQCKDKTFRNVLEAHATKLQSHFGIPVTEEIFTQPKRHIHMYSRKRDVRRRLVTWYANCLLEGKCANELPDMAE